MHTTRNVAHADFRRKVIKAKLILGCKRQSGDNWSSVSNCSSFTLTLAHYDLVPTLVWYRAVTAAYRGLIGNSPRVLRSGAI